MPSRGYRIFNRRSPHRWQAYELFMPGVHVVAEDLPVERVGGRWRVTQPADDHGGPWTGEAADVNAAVLSLIAARLGYRAEFTPLEKTEEESRG